ncbi:MAG: hypothetical protein V1746_06560 [bacterium]
MPKTREELREEFLERVPNIRAVFKIKKNVHDELHSTEGCVAVFEIALKMVRAIEKGVFGGARLDSSSLSSEDKRVVDYVRKYTNDPNPVPSEKKARELANLALYYCREIGVAHKMPNLIIDGVKKNFDACLVDLQKRVESQKISQQEIKTKERLKRLFLKAVSETAEDKVEEEEEKDEESEKKEKKKPKPLEAETEELFIALKYSTILKLERSRLNSPTGAAAIRELALKLEEAIRNDDFDGVVLAETPHPDNKDIIEKISFQFSKNTNYAYQKKMAVRLLRFAVKSFEVIGTPLKHKLTDLDGRGSDFAKCLSDLKLKVGGLEQSLGIEDSYAPRRNLNLKIIGAEEVKQSTLNTMVHARDLCFYHIEEMRAEAKAKKPSNLLAHLAGQACRHVIGKGWRFLEKGCGNVWGGKPFLAENHFIESRERLSRDEAAAYASLKAIESPDMRRIRLAG